MLILINNGNTIPFRMTKNSPNAKKENRIFLFLLVGLFSMQYAEVLSGSSKVWFIDPFFILLTFPLYMLHVLFYFTLANYFDRIELKHLYLWGILFGLYEAPMTKVIFSGYVFEKPILGTIGGIAYFEFLTIILLWHPVFSLILPILTYDIFLMRNNKRNILLIPGSHLSILTKSTKKTIIIIVSAFFLGSLQAKAESYNLLMTIIAHAGTLLIGLFFWFMADRKHTWEFDDLSLGKKGLIITIITILIMYLIGWINTPQPAANTPITYLILLLFVLFILFLLKINAPREHEFLVIDESRTKEETFYGFKHYLMFFILIILFSILFCLVPILGEIVANITYLLIPLLGIILFITIILKIISK